MKTVLADELANKSDMVGQQIDNFFDQRMADIKVMSQASEFEAGEREAITQYLDEVLEANPSISDAIVVDDKGTMFATAGTQEEVGKKLADENAKLVELYNSALKETQGDVFLTDAVQHGEGLSVFLLTPITDDSKTKVISVLVIEVTMDHVEKMVTVFDDSVIGDKAVYLLNDDSEVIVTGDDNQNILQKFNDLKVDENILKATEEDGSKGNAIYKDFYGDEVMAGMADMRAHGKNEALDWGIVAVAPMKDIAAPALKLRDEIILVSVIAIIIYTLAAVLFIRRIVTDLTKLVAGMDKLAKGGLSKVDIKRKDELGDLANSVENLVTQLEKRAEVSNSIAAGDLTQRVEVLSEEDSLGKALKKMVDNLVGMIESIKGNSENLNQSSSHLSKISKSLLGEASETTTKTTNASSTTDEVSDSIRNSASAVE